MEIYLVLIVLILAGFIGLAIPHKGSKRLTGPATVASKQLEHGRFGGKHSSSWNYLVTFRLSDGQELTLYTFENQYLTLKEGQHGMLTWNGEHFTDFISD